MFLYRIDRHDILQQKTFESGPYKWLVAHELSPIGYSNSEVSVIHIKILLAPSLGIFWNFFFVNLWINSMSDKLETFLSCVI